MKQVESLTDAIQECDRNLEQIARTEYPETELLQQVLGVGTWIALTFRLTVEDPERFQKSRNVGCYVGLRPGRSQSGQSDPQLRITKEGNTYLRKMLVQGAHGVMSRRAPDTDLRRWGWKLAERGGKNARIRPEPTACGRKGSYTSPVTHSRCSRIPSLRATATMAR